MIVMPSARSDLLIVLVLALASWLLAAALDVSERVARWAAPLEGYQADEIPVVLGVALLGLVWYAGRRAREARAQLASRVEVERRLADSLAINQRLSVSHVAVQETERRQIARELHDELGQHLNAIKIEAVALRDTTVVPAQTGASARAIVRSVDHLQAVLRDLLGRLRPVALDELGLAAALEHLADHWRGRHARPGLDLQVTPDLGELGEVRNIAIYRVVQESLTNVVRHASAGHVRVCLSCASDGIRLTIEDDGTGMQDGAGSGGLGINGMRERIEALGGVFEWTSRVGHGCRVSAWLPGEPTMVAGR